MRNELKIAIKAAKESGKILNSFLHKDVRVKKKSDNSPVTIADKESEKKIVSIIKNHFPDHNILAEEFAYNKTDSRYKWIIDPLDGTRNFMRRIPFFGNSIALEKAGKVVVGVINMPAMNLLAYAEAGRGSFLNGKKIRVSDVDEIRNSFLSFGNVDRFYQHGYSKQFSKLVNTCYSHRGFGDVLNYVFLAQGLVDIVVEFAKPWDIAAAKVIVEEAGGNLTDFNGNDSIYSGNSLATNGKLHGKGLAIMRAK
ncbi:MAG TPA: inositol monophosphatase family protein [Candidatus Nanoarchaeia archaeon]|nr:inositol monophosphatase family protein [Candidatus Nanoarchaeia archaeon]